VVTDQQVRLLMKLSKTEKRLSIAATKRGWMRRRRVSIVA